LFRAFRQNGKFSTVNLQGERGVGMAPEQQKKVFPGHISRPVSIPLPPRVVHLGLKETAEQDRQTAVG